VVPHSQPAVGVPEEELFVYGEDILRGSVICTHMEYWLSYIDQYPILSAVAPTSQAYTDLIFSVCGDLNAGKTNQNRSAECIRSQT